MAIFKRKKNNNPYITRSIDYNVGGAPMDHNIYFSDNSSSSSSSDCDSGSSSSYDSGSSDCDSGSSSD